MSKFFISALMFVSIPLGFIACQRSSATLQVGGIYSTHDGNGRYGIVKLLAYDNGLCHVRVYKQRFATRPAAIDPASLSLGEPGDPDGFGVRSMPIREAVFFNWNPVLITKTRVTPEESKDYKIWKDGGGEAF